MSVAVEQPSFGHCLNLPQRIATKNALLKVQYNQDLPRVSFWGQIQGSEKDYLIASSFSFRLDVVEKSWFYSNDDGVTFARLEPIDDWAKRSASVVKGAFKGNPAYKYKPAKPKSDSQDQEAEEAEEEDEKEEEPEEEDDSDLTDEEKEAKAAAKAAEKAADPNKNRKLLEVERLYHVVTRIDHETSLVPLGAFVLTPTKQVQPNSHWQGLSTSSIKQLSSFLLLRKAKNIETVSKIHKAGISNVAPFLDSLAEEEPKGLWTLHVHESGLSAVIRNLKWPGFEFNIQADSMSKFAGVYYGDGEPNTDLVFML